MLSLWRTRAAEPIAALRAAHDPGTLELRIGALPLTLVRPLPEALARLRKRLPQVHVRLGEGTVPELWRQIEAGELDAVVCQLPALSEQPQLPTGVAHRTVGQETLVLVCGRDHPIARRRKPPLALLCEFDWVLPPEGSYTRLSLEQLFLRAGLKMPCAAVTSMSFHANLRLVADGSLLAVAPRSAALAVSQVLGLVIFPLHWGQEDTAVTLIWREAKQTSMLYLLSLSCPFQGPIWLRSSDGMGAIHFCYRKRRIAFSPMVSGMSGS